MQNYYSCENYVTWSKKYNIEFFLRLLLISLVTYLLNIPIN